MVLTNTKLANLAIYHADALLKIGTLSMCKFIVALKSNFAHVTCHKITSRLFSGIYIVIWKAVILNVMQLTFGGLKDEPCVWGLQATARGEEGMTLFFVCCNPNCGHRWRDWCGKQDPGFCRLTVDNGLFFNLPVSIQTHAATGCAHTPLRAELFNLNITYLAPRWNSSH